MHMSKDLKNLIFFDIKKIKLTSILITRLPLLYILYWYFCLICLDFRESIRHQQKKYYLQENIVFNDHTFPIIRINVCKLRIEKNLYKNLSYKLSLLENVL